jgi:amino acid permease
MTYVRPRLIAFLFLAFVCHHNSFLIFGSLKQPSLNRFAIVTHWSMAIAFFTCFALALSGYLVFTDKTVGNILNNFPSDNNLINMARLAFGLNMFTTIPLEAFVCREVIWLRNVSKYPIFTFINIQFCLFRFSKHFSGLQHHSIKPAIF